jgi:hypothetical protein
LRSDRTTVTIGCSGVGGTRTWSNFWYETLDSVEKFSVQSSNRCSEALVVLLTLLYQ